MTRIPAKHFKRLRDDHGAENFDRYLAEAVKEKKISLRDVSLRDLAETFLGEGKWQSAYKKVAAGPEGQSLLEAGTAVDSTTFANIIGQLLFSTIRAQFESEAFVFSPLVPTIQSRIKGTETVPSIARIGDVSEVVGEGKEYPSFGFNEEFYTWAAKTKRGLMVEVTEEAIFFDLTNMVARTAGEVGEWLGLKREKDIIDVIIGATSNYSRNGTATATYLTAGAYVNNTSGVPLVDWTSVETAELLFDDITDPNTGEPINLLEGNATLITTKDKMHTARRILNATETRDNLNPAVATRDFETLAPNPLAPYRHVTSRLLKSRIVAGPQTDPAKAADWWFLGDLAKAFAWVENWPLQVFQQGANSEAAFHSDISLKFKARYRGVAQVVEPRYMVRIENVL